MESGLLVSWRHEGVSWIIQRHRGVLLKGKEKAEEEVRRQQRQGCWPCDGGRAKSQGTRAAPGSWGRPGEEFSPEPPKEPALPASRSQPREARVSLRKYTAAK